MLMAVHAGAVLTLFFGFWQGEKNFKSCRYNSLSQRSPTAEEVEFFKIQYFSVKNQVVDS